LLTLAGLARYIVLFVIEIETRRVQLAGILAMEAHAYVP
jgi:hypothetical protein